MVSSEFISKIEFACKKKESLYSQSKFKYAIRSMFAGAFLTFSTAAGAVGADLINKIAPGSGRFLFPFVFAWGLAYIVFLNAELVGSSLKSPILMTFAIGFIAVSESIIFLFKLAAASRKGRLAASPPAREGQ